MDDLNPADFTALQPYFDSMRVKRRVRKKVLDDAARQFPSALVLFKDDGNICSTRNVTSVPSIHETYPLHILVKNFIPAAFNNNPWMQGDAGACPFALRNRPLLFPKRIDSFSAFSQRTVFGTRRYSLPLRIAAIKRGLRRPCITATTHNGSLSGA